MVKMPKGDCIHQGNSFKRDNYHRGCPTQTQVLVPHLLGAFGCAHVCQKSDFLLKPTVDLNIKVVKDIDIMETMI